MWITPLGLVVETVDVVMLTGVTGSDEPALEWDAADLGHQVLAGDDLAIDRIAVVQFGLRAIGDEELLPVGIQDRRSCRRVVRVSDGHRARAVEGELLVQFQRPGAAAGLRAALDQDVGRSACRVAREVRHDPEECRAVHRAGVGKRLEGGRRVRRQILEVLIDDRPGERGVAGLATGGMRDVQGDEVALGDARLELGIARSDGECLRPGRPIRYRRSEPETPVPPRRSPGRSSRSMRARSCRPSRSST